MDSYGGDDLGLENEKHMGSAGRFSGWGRGDLS